MADSTLPQSPLQLPDIIQRYSNGESLQQLATESHRHVRTLYNWLLSGLGDTNYHALVTECLVNRIADADQQLEDSTDMLQIARSREAARYARMDLERRRPQLYGPKQEVKMDTQITVVIQRLTEEPKTTIIESQAHEQTDD